MTRGSLVYKFTVQVEGHTCIFTNMARRKFFITIYLLIYFIFDRKKSMVGYRDDVI